MNAPRVPGEERAGAPAFEGRLSVVSLFDICQFLMLNRKTGTLTARSGAHHAYLTFHEGQLMNAVDEALREGEPVILGAVQWAQGMFSFEAGPVPPDRRIHSSTENILLEAARALDEMQAGDALEHDDEELSHVEALKKGKEWTSALGEAFRHAVTEEGQGEERNWRERATAFLSSDAGRRVILGPGARIVLYGRNGANVLTGATSVEVDSWAEEIHPSPLPGDELHKPAENRRARVTSIEGGPSIWSCRLSSVHGPQLVLGRLCGKIPTWSSLGLGDDLAQALDSSPGILVLAASDEDLASAAAAAWVTRRVAAGECGWVIETWPEHDWRQANGLVMTATPEEVESEGGLAKLVELVDARFSVLREPTRESVLRDALSLSLSSSRHRVLLTATAETASAAMRSIDHRLQSDGRSTMPWTDALAGVWLVERSAPRSALRCRLVVPNQKAA